MLEGGRGAQVQLAGETSIQLDNQGQRASAQSFIKGADASQNTAK